MIDFKTVRDYVTLAFTFWKTKAVRKGITLSMRGASPRVRFALLTDYEHEDARLCQQFLTSQDRVLEIGSAIGFLSLFCRKKLGIRDFAMVEANPELLDIIEENYRLNGMEPPKVLNVAAGPDDRSIQFGISRDYFSSSASIMNENTSQITVDQKSIPSIIGISGFTPNTLIMDIEGGEIDIPAEHFNLFDKIIIELHGRFVGDDKIRHLIDTLTSLGFRKAAEDGYSCAFLKPNQA